MAASYSMSSLVYFNISELHPGRNTDGVKVRVIRCYRQPSSQKSDPGGTLELVLHDEIEDHIHASMDYGLFKEKKVEIVEGSLYKIRNFRVAHDMSSCISTTNPLKLRLYKSTTINPFQDSDFPTSMYRFRDFIIGAPTIHCISVCSLFHFKVHQTASRKKKLKSKK